MELLMSILSSLIEFSWQIIFNFKKNLVGDLTMQDIISFARERKLPKNLAKTLNYAQERKPLDLPNGSYSFIANYGLLGKLLGINFAVVIGNQERSQALKELVNTTDNLPNGRAPYRIGNHTTGGVPVLASRSGPEGLQAHKYLAQVLPSMDFVIETAVRFTHEEVNRHVIKYDSECCKCIEATKRSAEESKLDKNTLDHQIRNIKNLHEYERYKLPLSNLVLRIMAYVLVGFELKEEHYELIHRMARTEQGLAHDYQMFVDEVIQYQKINPSTQCALWKALYQRHAQPGDSLIHDLFTVLVTYRNVDTVVAGGRFNRHLLTAFIEELKATPQDSSKRQTLRYDALKQMFEASLHLNSFEPASLPRYIEKPLEWEGQTIPGGTNLFIHHRSLETKPPFSAFDVVKETKNFAFSFGYRSCPGQRLAEYIFRGIITTLVEIQYINPHDTLDVDQAISYH
jgi:hypothetical protein